MADWFDFNGTRSTTLKGNLWKSFFHHPRALWRCHRLATSPGS